MIEIGRLCMKIAGRDAGHLALIIDVIDDKFVLIDGNVRRKKCNIKHLEPLDKKFKIKSKATTKEVQDVMQKEGLKVIIKKGPKKKEEKKETKPKKTAKKTKVTTKKPVKKQATKKKVTKTKVEVNK